MSDVNINDEREVRLKKLTELEESGILVYPYTSKKTHTVTEALAEKEGTQVCISGRIMTKRAMGKLTFCHVQDQTGKMQIALQKDKILEDKYKQFVKKIDMGDIVEFSGERFITHKGEDSILVSEWNLMNKTLLPLPDKFHGLKDKEIRYRKRYLDLITDKEVFERFKMRSRIITLVREFLNTANFMEVETPILQVLYGGTNAKPFETHINAYDMKMYMRVAPELYLKRLIVGGYERVYELGRNFRNEGVDQTHNPEFTMVEWYEAYTDYTGMMNRAEGLYKFIAKELFGKLEIPVGDRVINLDFEWPRMKMVDAIKKHTGLNVLAMSTEELTQKCAELNIEIRGTSSKGQMIMEIFEKEVTDELQDPIWIIDYPKEVSPLAKAHRDNPDFVERFECYIQGKEIGDGWSEIIDPRVQRARFENEQQSMRDGDDESHPMDEDFLEALEYGMPPLGGIGIGIDRLVMLFTNHWSIRDILFFPTMKPEKQNILQINNKEIENDTQCCHVDSLPMNRDAAWKYLQENTKKETNLHHYLESEAVMRELAEKLGKNVEYWGMLGLMHDIDWEETEDNSTLHLTKAPDMLKSLGFDDDFIEIIISHGYGFECANLQNKIRIRKVEHALACSETVTGLVYAAARLRPDKISSLTVKSLKKKFKDKKFAATVNREVIKECENLGLELDEFLQLSIDALKKISDKIGL
jgi:lysyl-tRNA synthetase, class II